ncbi:MAG: hypothetical protein Q4D26_10565 [Clostridia bacterium]|nr:hypothetical protein [Clostridia bacterium]
MSYYNTCPCCGSNLDPGEKCDCEKKRNESEHFFLSRTKVNSNGQLSLIFK